MKRVVLGLSGGVDSAVAAAKLKSMGYEVHGLFLEVGLGGTEAAQAVADDLGISLFVAHEKASFENQICTYFASEFQNARTPNPCIVCNPLIKFRALIDYADEINAEYIATGHYARTGTDANGRPLLLRAQSEKDQAYMLYRLSREVVGRCIFPLGNAENKNDIRQNASEMGLSVADKPDSMDICFIPDGDVHGWLARNGATCPEGNFIDEQGTVLGKHKGIHCYTVGQRKGLGVAAEGRLFVKELKPQTNEIVLSLNDMRAKEVDVSEVNFIAPEYAENGAFSCEVRVRYSKRADKAMVYPNGTCAHIVFEDSVRAPAAGQSAVFYDGNIVIGGGFIEPQNFGEKRE